MKDKSSFRTSPTSFTDKFVIAPPPGYKKNRPVGLITGKGGKNQKNPFSPDAKKLVKSASLSYRAGEDSGKLVRNNSIAGGKFAGPQTPTSGKTPKSAKYGGGKSPKKSHSPKKIQAKAHYVSWDQIKMDDSMVKRKLLDRTGEAKSELQEEEKGMSLKEGAPDEGNKLLESIKC